MSLDPRLLTELGRLARLRIEGPEATRLAQELARIIDYFDLLATIDPGAAPMPEPSAAEPMPLRPDEVRAVLPHDEALGAAPQRFGGEFVVPRLLPPIREGRTGRDDEGRS